MLPAGDEIAIRIFGTVATAPHYASGSGGTQVLSYDTSNDAIRYTSAGRIALEFKTSTLDDLGGGANTGRRQLGVRRVWLPLLCLRRPRSAEAAGSNCTTVCNIVGIPAGAMANVTGSPLKLGAVTLTWDAARARLDASWRGRHLPAGDRTWRTPRPAPDCGAPPSAISDTARATDLGDGGVQAVLFAQPPHPR